MSTLQPVPARLAPSGMVCSVDHLASAAGADVMRRGGSAADAAVAASAVLAVTTQHLCGLGGDLWAVVHPGPGEGAVALDASGRAGSGADAGRLRAAGHRSVPPFGHPAAVTLPGCADGWLALHRRFGRLALAEVLAPARHYAEAGFPASADLVASFSRVAQLPGTEDYHLAGGLSPGRIVRRAGVARALEAIATGDRAAFYSGVLGEDFLGVTAGEHRAGDLERSQADWVDPVHVEAWGHRIWTSPPASQGYLTASAAWIAAGFDLADPDDPAWAHLLVESTRQASFDRPVVLHEGASGAALVDPVRLAARRAAIDPERAGELGAPFGAGDTIGLCAVDSERMGVSLVQSNASGWGSGLVVPGCRIFLHNRGRGFSLEAGHPAELAPGRRPPHTLCPTLVTRPDGSLRLVAATMGGDAQPQILLQLLARVLAAGQDPGEALAAGRFALGAPLGPDGLPDGDGFETWRAGGRVSVQLEGQVAPAWLDGLRRRGHQVRPCGGWDSSFGHANLVEVDRYPGVLSGGSDPRAAAGGAVGW